jgi:hypothetical protein
MPISPYVKNLAEETGKSTEEIQGYWEKAKQYTQDAFNIEDLTDFEEEHYNYTKAVVYQMLGLDEQWNISEFIQSDMSAKDFIEQAVQVSGDFDIPRGGQTHKRTSYQDDPTDEDEEKMSDDYEPKKSSDPEEEKIFAGYANITQDNPPVDEEVESEEPTQEEVEQDEDYQAMLNDDALPNE